MQIVEKNLADLREYENNPRNNDNAVAAVAESIKEFGFKAPIVIDAAGVIIAGHTRAKAAARLGLQTVPCIVADDLTETQIRAYRLADNKTGELASWDFAKLETELAELSAIEFDTGRFGFDFFESENELEEKEQQSASLADQFGAPPFSVLDARQGYWQKRKKEWKSMGIKSEKGREAKVFNNDNFKKDGYKGFADMSDISIFDPVLCEIAYKWFCPEGGKIYDCFAGGSVRGVVASVLGYDYSGIDLRKEQIAANYENAEEMGVAVKWYCDDSMNADLYIEDGSVDMVFSCPPYADLEVYSDDPRDISNMKYDDFIKAYSKIIEIAARKLKEDRFAVFVVGDVRDKKGFYRNFVTDTKNAFISCGCNLYNELILVEPIGTAAVRANKIFTSGRKCVKTHQHVLVFYKGDPRNIKQNYGNIEIDIENFIDTEAA